MELKITRATINDAEDISEIENKSFSVPWSLKSIKESLDSPTISTIKAVDGTDKLVGYASLMQVADQAELLNIAVSTEHRREGIGKILLDSVIKTAESDCATEIFLEVRESNIAARTLYTKSGFEEIAVRKNYYTHPTENAIIMRKTPEETK